MEKEFITYELALELKELGFNEPCLANYVSGLNGFEKLENKLEIWNDDDVDVLSSSIKAPLFQQSFEWFREKGYYNYITSHLEPWGYDEELVESYGYRIFYKKCDYRCEVEEVLKRFDTYEEARLECLKKLVEIVQSKLI